MRYKIVFDVILVFLVVAILVIQFVKTNNPPFWLSVYGMATCPHYTTYPSKAFILSVINTTSEENVSGACALGILTFYNSKGYFARYDIPVNITALDNRYINGNPNIPNTLNSRYHVENGAGLSGNIQLICEVTPFFGTASTNRRLQCMDVPGPGPIWLNSNDMNLSTVTNGPDFFIDPLWASGGIPFKVVNQSFVIVPSIVNSTTPSNMNITLYNTTLRATIQQNNGYTWHYAAVYWVPQGQSLPNNTTSSFCPPPKSNTISSGISCFYLGTFNDEYDRGPPYLVSFNFSEPVKPGQIYWGQIWVVYIQNGKDWWSSQMAQVQVKASSSPPPIPKISNTNSS